MTQYIYKSALVAEIEREKAQWRICKSSEAKYRLEMLDDISDFVDTIEVKEVDLEEEFDKYCDNLYLIDLENEPYAELFECAKHFFELGLKAQKGE